MFVCCRESSARYDVMEDEMEPTNRPYVDPATEPGDAGTEPWAEDPAGSATGDRPTRAPETKPGRSDTPSGEDEAIEGSPADHFLTGEGAISARDEEGGQAAGE
jgi:hypothetical protein